MVPEPTESPGSVTTTLDTVSTVSLVITTSRVCHRTCVGSFTCCIIPKEWSMLLNFRVSLSDGSSRCKFRSPVKMMFLSVVAYFDKNWHHSSSKKVVDFKPLSFDGGGL
ncbi:hypothetical protein DPMN_146876 [Dreissena polymorpha]|uniref:Uncharacterized protein n=1 Tax=Dreissena polymorpha TaxID=45954 RepID=A0A9D4J2H5_DREPO|nr:hypothetical protein DPMN_146876 [Dreissena polymorpha]